MGAFWQWSMPECWGRCGSQSWQSWLQSTGPSFWSRGGRDSMGIYDDLSTTNIGLPTFRQHHSNIVPIIHSHIHTYAHNVQWMTDHLNNECGFHNAQHVSTISESLWLLTPVFGIYTSPSRMCITGTPKRDDCYTEHIFYILYCLKMVCIFLRIHWNGLDPARHWTPESHPSSCYLYKCYNSFYFKWNPLE